MEAKNDLGNKHLNEDGLDENGLDENGLHEDDYFDETINKDMVEIKDNEENKDVKEINEIKQNTAVIILRHLQRVNELILELVNSLEQIKNDDLYKKMNTIKNLSFTSANTFDLEYYGPLIIMIPTLVYLIDFDKSQLTIAINKYIRCINEKTKIKKFESKVFDDKIKKIKSYNIFEQIKHNLINAPIAFDNKAGLCYTIDTKDFQHYCTYLSDSLNEIVEKYENIKQQISIYRSSNDK